MSLTLDKMKQTRIQYTDKLGTANIIRGAVIAGLRLLSNDVRFAGGAARDLLDGVEPKDYDLIIPRCSFNRAVYDGEMCRDEATDTLNGLLSDLTTALGDDVIVQGFSPSMSEPGGDFDDRILAAGSVSWRGVTVDILLSSADTLLAALDGFDSDINQAAVMGSLVWSVDVGSYKMLMPHRSECRYQKLLAVAQRRGTHLNRYEPTEI